MLNDGVAKMSEDLRPRWLALAYEKIHEIGCFVQAVQRFSADCKILEHSPAFFRWYDLANWVNG
jgi:hypothetical protein